MRRKKYGDQLALEGRFLINDVIEFGYPTPIRIYYSEEDKLSKIKQIDKLKESNVEFLKVKYSLMKEHSNVVTPQGLIGVFEMNIYRLFDINAKRNQNENQIPLTVLLNGVRDPGNIGALIRSSLAIGVIKLLCLNNCPQLLKDKVIRSSSGSIFQLPFIENIDVAQLDDHLPENASIYLTDSNLNLKHYILDGTGEDYKSDEVNRIDCNIKASNYSDVNYFTKSDDNIVLIINGETGVTGEIVEFVKSKNATRINIPLVNNVDSLNTAVAASVLMFELKRQYLNIRNK